MSSEPLPALSNHWNCEYYATAENMMCRSLNRQESLPFLSPI
jgi:hypothetical protein